MGCVVVHPGPNGALYKVIKGQLDGKPCRWKITIWYDVGQLEPDEKNPRSIKVSCQRPTLLRDVSPLIDAALREDHANCGGVSNIKWQAIQER